ncbi:hypothetical protein CLOM_g5262 [Closterium sp. NIES-68]|nr:hypothetical protein CLOM_g5262 [Closterium sp. NIES-68]GJP72548.1 hypothetical protein CLOP_g3266 [Closterium sp. NIES-67]
MASALASLVSHTNLRSLLIFALVACFAFLSVEVGYNLRYTATTTAAGHANPSFAHVATRAAASLLLPRHQPQAAQPRPGESAEEVLGKLRAEIEKQQLRTAKRQLFRDEVRTLMDEIARLKANHSGPIKAEDLKTFADVSNGTGGGGGGGGGSGLGPDAVAAAAELAKCEASLQECRESLGRAGGMEGTGVVGGTNVPGGAATGGAPVNSAASGSGGAVSAAVVARSENETLAALQTQCEQQQILNERLQQERERLAAAVAHYSRNTTDCNDTVSSDDALQAARKAIQECGRAAEQARESAIGGGYSSEQLSAARIRATSCTATDEELLKYLSYSPKKPCPDDWYLVQHLIFVRNCFCLPRRRCFAAAPPDYQEPSIPFPQSVFDPRALLDANVRWDLHRCKSYTCINSRLLGDCRDCFNLTLEAKRWKNNYRGAVTMEEVMGLKPQGSVRIGLDAGGGTGSFAAAMALYNVTILTTAMNTETVQEVEMGLPYMETIAQRGLVPLHVPHKARQPFFDNTLDLIHTVNSIKYFSIPEFEELLFEWDRILRPGGIWWFELFYAPVWEMPLYIGVIEQFGYGKKYWNLTPKTDTAEREGEHVYLNCVLEKPSQR